jgi:hypothetical protein
MPDSKIVDIAAELRHETDKAFLVFDGAKEVWLPKSLVEHDDLAGASIFTMPEWLAKREGLI